MELNLSAVKAFVFDVDGVLTDGGIYSIVGDLLRKYDAKDCFGLRMASMHGYHLGIISGGVSPAIPQRFLRCGFKEEDIYLGSRKKMEQLDDFCARHGITYADIMYFGDDVPDIPPLVASGIGVCPADAMEEVKAVADYVSPDKGGQLLVRHMVEKVMRAQGKWELDVELYKQRF